MRPDKWSYLLNLLVRKRGDLEGKRRFLELWEKAGERLLEEYEADRELRGSLRVLDGVRR